MGKRNRTVYNPRVENYKMVFIVEGKNDLAKTKRAIHDLVFMSEKDKRPEYIKLCKEMVDFIVTDGTRFNDRIRLQIDLFLHLKYKVFILTDPDHQGNHLARTIRNNYPFLPRVELDRERCTYILESGKIRIGVEYADSKYLRNRIKRVSHSPYDFELNTPVSNNFEVTSALQVINSYR